MYRYATVDLSAHAEEGAPRMRKNRRWLVYGTGRMASELVGRARAEGLDVTVAGRNARRGQTIADRHGITCMELSLDRPHDIPIPLEHFEGIINTAGPFSTSTRRVLDLCLRHRLSYIDFSNEHLSHRAVWAASSQARQVGIVLVPGAGFGTLAAETLARAAAAQSEAIENFFVVLPQRYSKASTPGVRNSTAQILASTPAEVRNGEIHDLPPMRGIRRIRLPDGPATIVPIRNGDLEALSRVPGLGNVRVYARLSLPPWVVRAALPSMRRHVRRSLLSTGSPGGFSTPRADSDEESPPVDHAKTLWAGVRSEANTTRYFGFETAGDHSFAVESALDVVAAVEERRFAGTFSPLEILEHQTRYRTSSRLLLP